MSKHAHSFTEAHEMEKTFEESLLELGFKKPNYFYEKGNIQVNYSMNGKWNVWEKGTYNLFGQVTTIEQLKNIIDEK